MDNLKISDFEGPLDLLLHLIKESKVDIFDINIVEITDKYLEFIHKMESMNLDIASEYLVMASELIELKSRLLLPKEKIEEDTEEIDPKEELINRLVEYQRYKDMRETFRELENIRSEIYTKSPENINLYLDDEYKVDTDITLDDLVNAFQKFIERKELDKPLSTKVTNKGVTVSERRKDIKRILKDKKKVKFFDLFTVFTKEYIVVTFMTVLEMAKEHELVIKQENNFEDIYCEVPHE